MVLRKSTRHKLQGCWAEAPRLVGHFDSTRSRVSSQIQPILKLVKNVSNTFNGYYNFKDNLVRACGCRHDKFSLGILSRNSDSKQLYQQMSATISRALHRTKQKNTRALQCGTKTTTILEHGSIEIINK